MRDLVGDPDVEQLGQHGDAEEQDAREEPHDRERRRGVLRLWTAERLYAVGNRLDAGEGGRARGERPQEEEQGQGRLRLDGQVGRGRHMTLATGTATSPVRIVAATITTNP